MLGAFIAERLFREAYERAMLHWRESSDGWAAMAAAHREEFRELALQLVAEAETWKTRAIAAGWKEP